MRVRLLRVAAGPDLGSHDVGSVLDVPENIGHEWIKSGAAEEVDANYDPTAGKVVEEIFTGGVRVSYPGLDGAVTEREKVEPVKAARMREAGPTADDFAAMQGEAEPAGGPKGAYKGVKSAHAPSISTAAPDADRVAGTGDARSPSPSSPTVKPVDVPPVPTSHATAPGPVAQPVKASPAPAATTQAKSIPASPGSVPHPDAKSDPSPHKP